MCHKSRLRLNHLFVVQISCGEVKVVLRVDPIRSTCLGNLGIVVIFSTLTILKPCSSGWHCDKIHTP